MLYLFRLRRIIKITLEEYGGVGAEGRKKAESYFKFPRQSRIYKRFKVLRKKSRERIFSYVLAIGEADGYIKVHEYPTLPSIGPLNISPTIAITKKGVKFITPSFFINTVIGAISPGITILFSALAIAISILVAIYK